MIAFDWPRAKLVAEFSIYYGVPKLWRHKNPVLEFLNLNSIFQKEHRNIVQILKTNWICSVLVNILYDLLNK